MTEYYDKEIECIPQNQLKELQLKLFNQQLKRANRTSAYLGKLPNKVKELSEIEKLPFTTKDDLRQNFPYGFLAVSQDKIARFNASSGTTGIPTLAYFTKRDLQFLDQRSKLQSLIAGIKKGDIIQCMMGYGLFTGAWYHVRGIQDIATVIPTGACGTEKQMLLFKTLKPKIVFSTPGYLQYFLSQLADQDIKKMSLKTAIVGGEPVSQHFKEFAKEKYDVEIYDSYGLTETGGPFAFDCECHSGLHFFEDQFYVEIINPNTGEVLPDGECGELVVTPLQQEAMPLIRYRTRDITRIIPGQCPCDRTHRRIEPITHRIDDMMIINGVNVFPSQIEECIYKHLTTVTNYLIHITEKEGLKKLLIDIELPNDLLNNVEGLRGLEKELITTMKAYITVTPKLNFIPMGTLPEIQGKAKRVIKD